MGVFISCAPTIYAINFPDSASYNADGRDTFVNFVSHAANWDANKATMVGVLNNSNRPRADGELADIARRLNIKSFRTVRLRKNIDISPATKEPAAVAVCLFRPGGNSSEIELRYQMDKNVQWKKGPGEARSGRYRAMRDDERLWTNSAWGAGWKEVDGNSCDLSLTKVVNDQSKNWSRSDVSREGPPA
jgi:hypothetical protein